MPANVFQPTRGTHASHVFIIVHSWCNTLIMSNLSITEFRRERAYAFLNQKSMLMSVTISVT
jgi:hypothetical protein